MRVAIRVGQRKTLEAAPPAKREEALHDRRTEPPDGAVLFDRGDRASRTGDLRHALDIEGLDEGDAVEGDVDTRGVRDAIACIPGRCHDVSRCEHDDLARRPSHVQRTPERVERTRVELRIVVLPQANEGRPVVRERRADGGGGLVGIAGREDLQARKAPKDREILDGVMTEPLVTVAQASADADDGDRLLVSDDVEDGTARTRA